jgi:adenine-specific DNA methylase
MRLGCEVTANDLNPVAWFILKCTLDYPQRLAGETRALLDFALKDEVFMEAFLKTKGVKVGARMQEEIALAAGAADAKSHLLELQDHPWMTAEFGWHLRAWGGWVLRHARRELAHRYPTYAEWMALDPATSIDPLPLRLLPPDCDGQTSDRQLNSSISNTDLKNLTIPRWVMKPTVAYLWARTVRCKSCRATIPLLKTCWLCKRGKKRVRLLLTPNLSQDGVDFSIQHNVPELGTSNPARKQADKELGTGTMSATGVKCSCCGSYMRIDDLQYEAKGGRFGEVMTCVVVDGPNGKEYRRPTQHELDVAAVGEAELEGVYRDIPLGLPNEPISSARPSPNTRGVSAPTRYGFDRWSKLYTSRQLYAMGAFVRSVRMIAKEAIKLGYPPLWAEALQSYCALANDRLADYGSSFCSWRNTGEKLRNTFVRFALPMVWDFTETAPFSGRTGDYLGAIEWVAKVLDRNLLTLKGVPPVTLTRGSATRLSGEYDAIVTDPPYYDAIPYSDVMDYFYVWLRRSLLGMTTEINDAFCEPLGPKWDHKADDGELIDDSSRFNGDTAASKRNFENGMAAVFRRCAEALTDEGVLVIVFANKSPHAWETLVSALIRAGFVVDGSLPIHTEMANRTNAIGTASLSSSVWLVCRKRPIDARPGFSGRVLVQMRENIRTQMHRFWDAGIRGPDFVWAATGPALEAYSRHPVVFREASASGEKERMPVADFLREVRRIVVEFAVGRVLMASDSRDDESAASLDDITSYYVLHRDSFGMDDAPIGACILYAMSCGIRDADLTDRYEILAKSGGSSALLIEDEETEDGEDGDGQGQESSSGTGSSVRLRRWDQRKRRTLGTEIGGSRPAPMIDRLHRIMQIWKEGDVSKVNSFLDQVAVARDPLFAQLIQALIELARREGKADEAVLLETISNHLQSRSGISRSAQASLVL